MEKNDADAVRPEVTTQAGPVGYAVTFIQDFGGGRQVQVAFGLKPGAPKEALDSEFDKLRLVMNRQAAFMTLRDTTAKVGAERKMAAAIGHMIEAYEKEMNEQIKGLESSPRKGHTVVQNQAETMRQQLASYKQNKLIELQQHETNIAIAEAVIEGASKDVEG